MSLYVSVPIFSFYIFNNPSYIENKIIDVRRKMYPPINQERSQKFQVLKADIRQAEKRKIEAELLEFQA